MGRIGLDPFSQYRALGDNAVVIAMAARRLPDSQRSKAIFWGSAAAIVMRIALTLVAIQLLALPYLKVVGAILLIYIGVQLLSEGDDGGEDHGKQVKDGMMAAVRTILIADLVMSLDNVIRSEEHTSELQSPC